MRIIAGAIVALACALAAPGTHAGEDIYYVDQQTTIEGAYGGTITQQVLMGVKLQQKGAGGRMRIRQLWARMIGGGHVQDTLALDPADPDDASLIRVLATGFEARLARDGEVEDFAPVDAEAWNALAARTPRAAELLETMRQTAGMAPHPLPAKLSPGQSWSVRETLPGLGEVQWDRTVVQLEEDEVLVDVHAHGPAVELRGRQALVRANGMPIEAWLRLSTPPTVEAPATRSRLYLVNLRYLEGLETESDESYDDIFESHLRQPPFAGSAADAEPFLSMATRAEGELEPWMASVEDLDMIDPTLVFSFHRDHRAARPLLRIGGQMDVPRPYGEWPRALEARLRGVALLDRDGRELPGLEAVPVRRVANAILGAELELSENQARFPFRLPPGTPAAALEPLDRIRLDVDLTVYEWAGSETVAAGTAANADGRLAIDWNGRRATLTGGVPGESGIWTTVVALDAEGAPIPYHQSALSPFDPATAPGTGARRLAWERVRRPVRIEVVAAQPIAALQLRHHRWGPVRRQWTFRNLGPMLEDGPLVGVHYIAPPPAPPVGEHGAEVLAAMRIGSPAYSYENVTLEGELVPWAVAHCRAMTSGHAFEPVPGSGDDRAGYQDVIEFVEPSPGPGGRPGAFEAIDPNSSTHWAFAPPVGAGATEPLTATMECPAWTRRNQEPIATSACFQPEGDGWLTIRDACRGQLDVGTISASDAEGRYLAPLPSGDREHALRFWGEPAVVDYTLRSKRMLQRKLRLAPPG
jgi:hypothetical protein